MARTEQQIIAFNRGLLSKLALARVDLKRQAFSAEDMVNWMPRSLGSMMLRAGLGYIGATASNAAARYIPFIFATDDTALLEFTDQALRVWIDDVLVTRAAVTTAVVNGTFTTDLSSWTDSDQAGGVSAWVTGSFMGLTGNGSAAAIRDQQVSVTNQDRNVQHALKIIVNRGPVTLLVGSTQGADDYIGQTDLAAGTHSLAFTPTGFFWIRLLSRLERLVLVKQCTIEAAGVMSLPSPYLAADLDYIRAGPESQSADVVFVGCVGYQQRRIERRSDDSWSIVQYLPSDGPFRTENVGPGTITASAINGNVTLTASIPTFKTTQGPSTNSSGALFQMRSTGQTVTANLGALNDETNSILVTGVTPDRSTTIVISGLTGTGNTVQLQRSFDNVTFVDVAGQAYTADTAGSAYADGLDNSDVYYKLKCTVYVTGTAVSTLRIGTGSIVGVARITAVASTTSASAEVLISLGSTAATDEWAEGLWSDYRGWPSAAGFYESRLCWAGKDKIVFSSTDAFDVFTTENADGTSIGDSGPISRTIGSGPVDTINWILPLQRLIAGGQGAEHSVRSSAFDDPLTPSNCNIKPCSTQGSAAVQAQTLDSRGVFVQRGGTRIFELDYDANGYDYNAQDLCVMVSDIGTEDGTTTHIVRMAIQRQPDTRIHCVRSDGTAIVLVYDKAENVLCWITLDCSDFASGFIEDVVVLPSIAGQSEDRVYYQVKYTINGSTVRYLLRWALESECQGATLNKQMDAYISGTNSPASATITGLTHLVGATVVAWYDGICPSETDGTIKTFVVNGAGEITVPDVCTSWVVGGGYQATWNSMKLGQALTHFSTVDHLGVLLQNTHPRGLMFGSDADNLDPLPLMYNATAVDPDVVYEEFDQEPIPFPGTWSTNSRLYLLAQAPRPVTVLAAIVDGQING